MAYPKQSLAEKVCEELRELIRSKRWLRTLPGIRVLCEEIQVSSQTMMLALRLLEQEGYLLPPDPGKPRAINQKMVSPVKPAGKKGLQPTILILTQYSKGDLTQTDAQICNLLKKSITAQGYTYRHVAFPLITRAMGAKRVSDVIEQNPADVYVVMSAHPQCSRALKRLGVPAVYIGGVEVKGATPRICYSLLQMCHVTLEHLVSRGHRKISLLLPENLNSASKKASSAEKPLEPIFKSNNLPFTAYNCPRWGKTKAEFNAALEQLFKVTPPTALILGDVSQATRVVCFLMRHGLKFPDDVSLIVLDESRELNEYEPPISYIKGNIPAFAKSILNSVRKKLLSQPDDDLIVTPTKLEVTGSLREI